MLFESLDQGTLRLDQKLKTSRRAAGQPASKLGLRQGERITVRQAILALVTKSANDVATMVAETIAGSEFKFALMMTQRARDLGMSRTTFRNASGLPNRRQKSTARDMARLAMAIRRDFPHYFGFFSRTSFRFHGNTYNTHNNLLGKIRGVDGIKTGYIRASGFNLVTTASRDEGRLVGVLFGGRSAKSRDKRMRTLLARGFKYLKRGSRKSKPAQYVRPRGRLDGFGHVPVPKDKPQYFGLADASGGAKTTQSYPLGWSIQIGAFRHAASAQNHFAKLSRIVPNLLSLAKLSIDIIESRRSITYRARLHSMDERQAKDLCRRIRNAKFDCLMMSPTEASLKLHKSYS
jgi:D-alanyl-D-alanine carboxypeptidase